MTDLTESPTYEAGIYQLEEADPVQGGAGGVDNLQAQQLANRTAWLKQQVDTLNASAGNWAPKESPQLTGSPTAPTASAGNNSTRLATTAFVQAAVAAGDWAPKASPALTGNPTAPTQSAGNNSTRLATTAFVQAGLSAFWANKVTISTAQPSGGTNGDIWFVVD